MFWREDLERINHELNRMRRAIVIFLLLNLMDCLITWYGLTHSLEEGNPIAAGYMDLFGVYSGLLFYKFFLSGFLILGVALWAIQYRRKRGKDGKGERILHCGSLAVLGAILVWVFKLAF